MYNQAYKFLLVQPPWQGLVEILRIFMPWQYNSPFSDTTETLSSF